MPRSARQARDRPDGHGLRPRDEPVPSGVAAGSTPRRAGRHSSRRRSSRRVSRSSSRCCPSSTLALRRFFRGRTRSSCPIPSVAIPGSRGSGDDRRPRPRPRGACPPAARAGGRARRDEREPPRRPDPRTLDDVPAELRAAAAAVVDGGELPGTPSTVIDVTGHEPVVLREGAVPAAEALRAVASVL